jgi:hypothetical protein
MRHPIRLAAPLLALVLVSCSKSSTTAPGGGGADARGAALTGESAFESGTLLAWSAATNEVIGAAKAGGTLGGPGLVAVRLADGAPRLLDADTALFPRVTPDGASVIYDAVTPDSTVLRRRLLGGAGTTSRLAAAPGLSAFTFTISADGRYLAYAGAGADPLEPDTVRVLDGTTGQRRAYAPGWPLVFSPGDGTLLVTPAAGGWSEVALASGATQAVDFALPGGATTGGIRWDASGLRALFTYSGNQLWQSTILGAQSPIYSAPETIVAPSCTWSPDGSRVAFWTVGPIDGGADTAYRLYVVSVAAQAGGVVAIGRSVGGAIAWSPDGTRLAYLFGERLFTASVVAAGAADRAR